MPTENLLIFFDNNKIYTGIDKETFKEAMLLSSSIFPV
jgi:hypothetical protein